MFRVWSIDKSYNSFLELFDLRILRSLNSGHSNISFCPLDVAKVLAPKDLLPFHWFKLFSVALTAVH